MPTEQRLAHVRRLAHWLDEGITIPGTRWRIGLDPILGLLPGAGDAAGAVLAAAIMVEGVRQGVSRYTLLRMAGNVALDAVVGVVPLFGDLFDAAWKANLRNMTLLERHVAAPADARRADLTFVVTLLGGLMALCVALIIGGALLSLWLLSLVGQWLAG